MLYVNENQALRRIICIEKLFYSTFEKTAFSCSGSENSRNMYIVNAIYRLYKYIKNLIIFYYLPNIKLDPYFRLTRNGSRAVGSRFKLHFAFLDLFWIVCFFAREGAARGGGVAPEGSIARHSFSNVFPGGNFNIVFLARLCKISSAFRLVFKLSVF